jgi:hypothetical protein
MLLSSQWDIKTPNDKVTIPDFYTISAHGIFVSIVSRADSKRGSGEIENERN